MSRIFIGVGSNEGERLRHISNAIRALAATPQIQVVQMAMILETEAVGPPQPAYFNTVVEIETDREPLDLLRALQQIERHLGRRPSAQRWGPRPIDLDLLLYEDRVIERPGLSIPHPRMPERRFVLEPLAQLAPEIVHPVLRRTVKELLAELASASVVSS